jgi:hypothetical protein
MSTTEDQLIKAIETSREIVMSRYGAGANHTRNLSLRDLE